MLAVPCCNFLLACSVVKNVPTCYSRTPSLFSIVTLVLVFPPRTQHLRSDSTVNSFIPISHYKYQSEVHKIYKTKINAGVDFKV